MSHLDKLEDCKKEIRSILISYQRGCLLSEFNRSYRDFIGRRLPIKEFGFQADIEFLYSMPDVVKITPTRTGEYHLQAVADEKSKHIQKLVSKQKPSKSKPLPRLCYKPMRCSNSYVVPPRFSEPISRQIWKYPDPQLQSKNEPKLSLREERNLPVKTVSKESKNLSKVPLIEKLPPKPSPREEVIELVKYFGNKIALDDLVFEYQRMYQKDLLLSKYGFSSIRECVEDILELDIETMNKCEFVVYRTESTHIDDLNNKTQATSGFSSDGSNSNLPNHVESSVKASPEVSSAFNSKYSSNQNHKSAVPNSLREKLQAVAERFTQGIWSSEFASCFEEATETVLDLHNIGYRSLNDLIDDVPDIFIKEPVAGSRKDFIIFSVNGPKPESNESTASNDCSHLSGKVLIRHVCTNLRKLLQAYPEGINVQEFLHIYSINFKDTLHIKDFGFDDLETFLTSLQNQVPLKIESSKDVKTIYLLHPTEKSPETSLEEVIPFDAADPEFKFKRQTIHFDFSKYFPVFMSSICNPAHLYIQLKGDETTDVLVKLGGDLDAFYYGNKSTLYTMKSCHIKVGATCVAKWPSDQHWYRAEIASILSMDKVLVYYADYGTRDIISPNLLRYMKKEFTTLPAQALRCRLAFLKPPNNAIKWSIEARNRILKLCEDVPLMAKVENTLTDGIYSIVLCDTNGEEDVYINDLLRDEGLAEYEVEDVAEDSPIQCKPVPCELAAPVEYQCNLNPLQALQAQYFLQAFVTVAPSFAQNENYVNLFRQVTMYCSSPSPVKQNVGMPLKTPVGPPGFNSLQSNMQTFTNLNVPPTAYQSTSTLGTIPDFKYNFNIPNSPLHVASSYTPVSTYSETSTFPKAVGTLPEENADSESEIFNDDDDEEIFQQFCQKVSSSKIRYVKRILCDGCKIHIIVVDSKLYASAGDISLVIWNNKDADCLPRRLQMKDNDYPTRVLYEDNNKEIFRQLESFDVKGVQKTTGCKTSILLYSLETVIMILNLFGHPSVILRTKILDEITNFNPDNPEWKHFSSPELLESEEEENISGVTDDDKIEKLCLFDLLAMKESITLRRKKMMTTSINSRNDIKSDEFDKLEQLRQKVLQRIQQIKEICNVFS